MDNGDGSWTTQAYRVDGSWTTQAYNNILTNLHEVEFVNLNKNNVKNRQKVLKEKWSEVHDLFCSLSGFAWNNISKVFEAENEVWDELLQVISNNNTVILYWHATNMILTFFYGNMFTILVKASRNEVANYPYKAL